MKIFFIVVILINILGAVNAVSQIPKPSPVFQSWNEIDLIVPLVKNKDAKGKSVDQITATLTGIVRIGRKDLDFVDNRAALTLDFRVNRYVSFLAGILTRRDELIENTGRYETRYFTGAIFSKIWNKFSFRDRNMFEYRARRGRNDIDVYRQRIQISHPVIYKEKELFAPFISEEGYYNLNQGNWFQNEFLAGISRKISSRASIELAYIRNDSKPVNVNGLSLGLKIKLR